MEEYARLGLTGARDLWQVDPEVVADLTRSLALEVGALPGAGTLSIAVEPTWGDPASAILDYARARRCDFVVMGAESRHGLARIAHVPVASRVAHQAVGVPVLFVPPLATAHDSEETHDRDRSRPDRPLRGREPRHRLCVRTACAARRSGRALSRPRAFAAVACLRLRARGREARRCRSRVPDLATARPGAGRGERLGITTHVTVIDGGKAAQAILQAAERLSVDSIVLGSHGHGGTYRALLGSVSKEVVQRAHRPVLVVPRPREAS